MCCRTIGGCPAIRWMSEQSMSSAVMTPLDYPVLTAEGAMRMLKQMAGEEQMKVFEKIKDSDFSYEVPGVGDSALPVSIGDIVGNSLSALKAQSI